MKRKPKQTVGQILLKLEELFDQLIDDHGFQWGDILWWVWGHLNIHRKDAQETEVGTEKHPTFKYEFEED